MSARVSYFVSVVAMLIASGFGNAHASDAKLDLKRSNCSSVELYKKGQTQEALEAALAAVSRNKQDWQAHALVSFYAWQQGNTVASIAEGEKAVKLAPRNELSLTNLAQMEEAIDACKKAIPIYEKCIQLNPDNPATRLGLANCLIKLGKIYDGFGIIEEMASRKAGTFEWYSAISDEYSLLKKPALALESAERAFALCSTAEQKSTGTIRLFSALLRTGQVDRARTLLGSVFTECRPKDYELYVQAADKLLMATDPSSAAIILQSALQNLSAPEDAEGFYRLGRIFEDRSAYVSYDREKKGLWLDAAGTAYSKAIAFDHFQARYALALAGVAAEQHDTAALTEQLKQAQALAPTDALTAFLVSHAVSQSGQSTRNGITPSTVVDEPKTAQLNLTRVRFEACGVSCSCHITMVENALTKVNGVAFVHISHQKPYVGTMLIDQSVAPPEKAFAKCLETLAGGVKLKDSELISFPIRSTSAPIGTGEAIRLAQNALYGDVLQFYPQVKAVQPILPWSSDETAQATRTGEVAVRE